MKLMQCWDDGVTTDVRLVALLRRHGARASFNLNAGLHAPERQFGWQHMGTEVWRLGRNELRAVYEGFTVANHALTHPHLDGLSPEALRYEVVEGRRQLQALFDQPVRGFVYPFGAFNEAVARAVREAGHVYARSTRAAEAGVDASDAMVAAPSCHVLDPDFWPRFERARAGGVFWFWGHSYEFVSEAMWADFEATLVRLCAEPGACWCDPTDLFPGDRP